MLTSADLLELGIVDEVVPDEATERWLVRTVGGS